MKIPLKILFNYGDSSYTVYLNGRRIVGPKPSAGTTTVFERMIERSEIEKSLTIKAEYPLGPLGDT